MNRQIKSLCLLAMMAVATLALHAQSTDSLRMDSLVHTLPEVFVKGERPIVKVEQGKLIYDVQRLVALKGIDNTYDALKELPGVAEMDGRLTLASLPATIVFDGKVMTMTIDQLTSLLKTFPATRVAKVEVMYNAPAKMQVRGAVINIVLNHHTDDGMPLQGELNLAWNQQHDARFGERATILYNKGKFAMDIMYLHSHGKTYKTTDELSNHSLADGTVHDVSTHETLRADGNGHDFRIGMDYHFAEKHQLSAVYTGKYNDRNNQQTILGSVNGKADINATTWMHNVRLDYSVPFGLKAGAEMTWYHNPEQQRLTSELPTGMLNYGVDNDQRINRWKFFLAQEHQLGNGWGMNYGAIYTTSINHSRQIYSQVSTTTNHVPVSSTTRLREDDVNLYMGFNKAFSEKLSVEASFAAEYYHTPIWHQWYACPTFNITWLPSSSQIFQIGLSSNREYPDFWTMTNFITYSNGGYNEVTGNPNLKPANSYQLQLVYVLKHKYQFVAWYNRTDDYFTQTPYQRSDRLTVSYQYQNLDFQRQAGVQAVVPFKVRSWLSSNLSLTGVWMQHKDHNFHDLSYNRNIAFGMANLRNTAIISRHPDVTLSVDGMLRSKAIQATYDLPASGSLDVSARWVFWKNHAILKVYGNDIFETSAINPRIVYGNQNLRMDFSCYREIGVSFTYRFGNYQERRREAVDTKRFKE